MAERYDVQVKVVSQKGICSAKHKIGDEWVIGQHTPPGLCHSAFNALYPNARALMFGGILPWSANPETATVACPDAENPVVFELRRLRK